MNDDLVLETRVKTERLLDLLRDPHPGLSMWQEALQTHFKAVAVLFQPDATTVTAAQLELGLREGLVDSRIDCEEAPTCSPRRARTAGAAGDPWGVPSAPIVRSLIAPTPIEDELRAMTGALGSERHHDARDAECVRCHDECTIDDRDDPPIICDTCAQWAAQEGVPVLLDELVRMRARAAVLDGTDKHKYEGVTAALDAFTAALPHERRSVARGLGEHLWPAILAAHRAILVRRLGAIETRKNNGGDHG